MNEIKTQAIVIDVKDYKDSDKKLALLSCEYGLIWATIKGVKKPKAKLASISQPFCFAEFVLNKKGEFYTVINASVIESFFEITSDFDKYIIGTAMLEFCKKTIKENDPSLELFVLILKSLKQLGYSGANSMAVLIRFLIDALAIIGYRLKFTECACCGSDKLLSYGFNYSYDYGGVVCKKCCAVIDNFMLENSEQGILKNISATNIDDICRLKFANRQGLINIISLIQKQFRLYTGEELKTILQYLN